MKHVCLVLSHFICLLMGGLGRGVFVINFPLMWFRIKVAVRFVLFGPIPSYWDSIRFLVDPFWCVGDGIDPVETFKAYVRKQSPYPVFSRSVGILVVYLILVGHGRFLKYFEHTPLLAWNVVELLLFKDEIYELLVEAVGLGDESLNSEGFHSYLVNMLYVFSDRRDVYSRVGKWLGSEFGRKILAGYVHNMIVSSNDDVVVDFLVGLSISAKKGVRVEGFNCDDKFRIYMFKHDNTDVLTVLDMREEVVLEK